MATRKAVKTVKNAVLYDDGMIRVSNIRFSHPHMDKPYKGEDDKGVAKYGVVGMLPKKSHKEAHSLVNGEINRVLTEKKVKALASDKKFLRDGDEAGKDEYVGMWTLSAREEKRPVLRKLDDNGELEVVDIENAKEEFYGGCWGSILIEPWWQDNKYGKRVNASLRAATKKKDDESFGKGRISDEEVDEAMEDDEEMDDDVGSSSSGKSSSRYEADEDDGDPDDI